MNTTRILNNSFLRIKFSSIKKSLNNQFRIFSSNDKLIILKETKFNLFEQEGIDKLSINVNHKLYENRLDDEIITNLELRFLSFENNEEMKSSSELIKKTYHRIDILLDQIDDLNEIYLTEKMFNSVMEFENFPQLELTLFTHLLLQNFKNSSLSFLFNSNLLEYHFSFHRLNMLCQYGIEIISAEKEVLSRKELDNIKTVFAQKKIVLNNLNKFILKLMNKHDSLVLSSLLPGRNMFVDGEFGKVIISSFKELEQIDKIHFDSDLNAEYNDLENLRYFFSFLSLENQLCLKLTQILNIETTYSDNNNFFRVIPNDNKYSQKMYIRKQLLFCLMKIISNLSKLDVPSYNIKLKRIKSDIISPLIVYNYIFLTILKSIFLDIALISLTSPYPYYFQNSLDLFLKNPTFSASTLFHFDFPSLYSHAKFISELQESDHHNHENILKIDKSLNEIKTLCDILFNLCFVMQLKLKRQIELIQFIEKSKCDTNTKLSNYSFLILQELQRLYITIALYTIRIKNAASSNHFSIRNLLEVTKDWDINGLNILKIIKNIEVLLGTSTVSERVHPDFRTISTNLENKFSESLLYNSCLETEVIDWNIVIQELIDSINLENWENKNFLGILENIEINTPEKKELK